MSSLAGRIAQNSDAWIETPNPRINGHHNRVASPKTAMRGLKRDTVKNRRQLFSRIAQNSDAWIETSTYLFQLLAKSVASPKTAMRGLKHK